MNRLEPCFVSLLPDQMEEGKLYVSMEFASVIHLCCCGCGGQVVTPLSPSGWNLWFDGDSISLEPSIGNWSFPCQSHYFITENIVVWDRKWTKSEISAGRDCPPVRRKRKSSPASSNSEKPADAESPHPDDPVEQTTVTLLDKVRLWFDF